MQALRVVVRPRVASRDNRRATDALADARREPGLDLVAPDLELARVRGQHTSVPLVRYHCANMDYLTTLVNSVSTSWSFDGARGPRCLVFASSEVVRRAWDYPPD